MKPILLPLLHFYKKLLIPYVIGYTMLFLYLDWNLLLHYGQEHWPDYLLIWFLTMLAYGTGGSLYYWGIGILGLATYRRFFKRKS
ncbi:MAG: hypothetical protein EP332_10805 [Bacteroidetes bacterium]|nr:MAG: hypothetical protein EP332_10805 [Bacteroidota bacterium]